MAPDSVASFEIHVLSLFFFLDMCVRFRVSVASNWNIFVIFWIFCTVFFRSVWPILKNICCLIFGYYVHFPVSDANIKNISCVRIFSYYVRFWLVLSTRISIVHVFLDTMYAFVHYYHDGRPSMCR